MALIDTEQKAERLKRPIEGERRAFVTGNEVVALAALSADADIMYGYPITPQNEIMHYWTRLFAGYGRGFLQTEDEISASFATLGGVMAGKRAFSATSGPGNMLMQEAMCMAEMMRLPSVLVVQQRGGPSTATVIYSQQEVTMTCFGGNGEGFRVVYSTSSHQELYDYTIRAFNTAWRYRFPVFVLGDGYQAKMREAVTLYDPAQRGIVMEPAEPFLGGAGMPGRDRAPRHLRNTYNTEDELFAVVSGLDEAYRAVCPFVTEYSEYLTADADIIIVAHGVVYRAARAAADELRELGIKAGVFRPITLRPFAGEPLRVAAARAKKLLVAESALGQLEKLVKNELYGITTPIEGFFRPGESITTEDLAEKVRAL